MANTETQYKRSMSGSIGAGMKSLVGQNGRRYYVLEHKVSSKYHRVGESQKIIVDQAILGRDATCQVRFDESFTTVSRRHAAIERCGDGWKLVQLSRTNSTYLNGHKVETEWYLKNGDEIQLATNGPVVGFIVPQGEQSLVKSIGLTARMNLFRQQALRPYRRAIIALTAALVLVIAGFVTYSIIQHNNYKKDIESYRMDSEAKQVAIDSLRVNNDVMSKKVDSIASIKSRSNYTPVPSPVELRKFYDDIYFIRAVRVEAELGDEEGVISTSWTGTGFLLNDGRFVTARHVIEPWAYSTEESWIYVNAVANSGGRVTVHFEATSSAGTIYFTNHDFSFDRSGDKIIEEDGIVCRFGKDDAADWATCRIQRRGKLTIDAAASTSLQMGSQLEVLGFPMGIGAYRAPSYSSARSAQDGLLGGVIVTTLTSFEHGNSGGPVFYHKNGKYVVVGIVSAGAGRSTGFVVPISRIR